MRLPGPEIDRVLLTVERAIEAAEGNAADGYTALLAGQRRTEEAQKDGEAWAEEQVERIAVWWRIGKGVTRGAGLRAPGALEPPGHGMGDSVGTGPLPNRRDFRHA